MIHLYFLGFYHVIIHIKKPFCFALLLSLSLASELMAASASYLKSSSPCVVLKTTGTNLFSRIAANQQGIAEFLYLMLYIVEGVLMPAIDYRYAAYRILCKRLKKSSKEQHDDFVEAM